MKKIYYSYREIAPAFKVSHSWLYKKIITDPNLKALTEILDHKKKGITTKGQIVVRHYNVKKMLKYIYTDKDDEELEGLMQDIDTLLEN